MYSNIGTEVIKYISVCVPVTFELNLTPVTRSLLCTEFELPERILYDVYKAFHKLLCAHPCGRVCGIDLSQSYDSQFEFRSHEN